MGFSAAHEDTRAASILPDVVTCEASVVSFTAIELLNFVDEPCYAGLVDQVETEINWGLASSASTEALVESILERSRSTGSIEYLELLEQSEAEIGVGFARPSANRPQAETRVGSVAASTSYFEAYIDYHNPSSPWAESLQVGGRATVSDSGARFEGFIDYHNPGAPDW
jgi:hypothetical protein